MKNFFWVGMCLIGGAYTAILFSTVFRCSPVQKAWNPELSGHCLPLKGFPYASGAINVISDFYILVILIPFIWSLNMKLHRKLRVLSIFGLGVL